MNAPGDFSFMTEPMERHFLEDAYKAVDSTGMWECIAKDPGEGGFMFSQAPELKTIGAAMKHYDDHSGASFGWTMRVMQAIAQKGWYVWVSDYLTQRGSR